MTQSKGTIEDYGGIPPLDDETHLEKTLEMIQHCYTYDFIDGDDLQDLVSASLAIQSSLDLLRKKKA